MPAAKRLKNRLLAAPFPLWLKIAGALFLAVMIPAYWDHYGWRNFLWFSDVAIFIAVWVLWTGNRLLASIAAVMVLIPELGWNIDFLIGLVTWGETPLGITGYMWDDERPLYIRMISLFHMPLVPLLIYLVYRLGYDRRALLYTTISGILLLFFTWLVVEPQENINWVYGPGGEPQDAMHPLLYLGLVIVVVPVAFFVPTHCLLRWWPGQRPRPRRVRG